MSMDRFTTTGFIGAIPISAPLSAPAAQPVPDDPPFVNMRVVPITLTEKMANRRVDVEQFLFDAARGIRPPPSPEQCRALAMHMGDPTHTDWLKKANQENAAPSQEGQRTDGMKGPDHG